MRPVKYLGKTRGYVDKDTYITRRTENHIFRKFEGFGISSKIALKLRKIGIKIVKVEFIVDGRITHYTAQIERFLRRGIRYTDSTEGKPDLQYILPKRFMREEL